MLILTDAELRRCEALLEQQPHTTKRTLERVSLVPRRRLRMAFAADHRLREHVAAARMADTCAPLSHSTRLRLVQAVAAIDALGGMAHAPI